LRAFFVVIGRFLGVRTAFETGKIARGKARGSAHKDAKGCSAAYDVN